MSFKVIFTIELYVQLNYLYIELNASKLENNYINNYIKNSVYNYIIRLLS